MAKSEIALMAETALATETAPVDEPALAGIPTVIFKVFGAVCTV
ncbi:MAG: hypothetical protein ABJQ90_10825 [Parasphingorhabdus sp.]